MCRSRAEEGGRGLGVDGRDSDAECEDPDAVPRGSLRRAAATEVTFRSEDVLGVLNINLICRQGVLSNRYESLCFV